MRDGDSGSDAMFDRGGKSVWHVLGCLELAQGATDLMSLWCIKEAFVPGLETFVQV